MKFIVKDTPTKRAERIMAQATKAAQHFITGTPEKVMEYGLSEDNKVMYVRFQTSGGIEDTFHSGMHSLSDAMSQAAKVIRFN